MAIDFENTLARARDIAQPLGLVADYLGDAESVGVGGDQRSYTRVINLRGPHPGNEALARLSAAITNTLPINRVTFEVGESLYVERMRQQIFDNFHNYHVSDIGIFVELYWHGRRV